MALPEETEYAREFSLFLFDNGIIELGEFTLSSGETSPYYIDIRKLMGHPIEYSNMIDMLGSMVVSPAQLWSAPDVGVVGVPTGGLAIAASLAYATKLPLGYVRKEAKSYGTGKRVEGMDVSGHEVVLIEDVVTTGGSVAAAIAPLREAGATVHHVCTVIDRVCGGEKRLAIEGVVLHSLLSILDLAEHLRAAGRISTETALELLMSTEVSDPRYNPMPRSQLRHPHKPPPPPRA